MLKDLRIIITNDLKLSAHCTQNYTKANRMLGMIAKTFSTRDQHILLSSFYRYANAIFGKVGRIASKETVLELIKTKCIPALMFGMEACPLKKRDINSLDFVVNRLFMKLLKIRH